MLCVYSWYDIKGIYTLLDAIETTSAETFINHINKHYQKVSDHIGYKVLPKESLVNQLGYIFMKNDQKKQAQAIFDFNIKNYPKSANVYDSMGDCYESQSNTVKAIECFKKAYEIGKSPESKEKLDKLVAKKN